MSCPSAMAGFCGRRPRCSGRASHAPRSWSSGRSAGGPIALLPRGFFGVPWNHDRSFELAQVRLAVARAKLMLRSHINTLIADAEDFFAASSFPLPPFAFWAPERLIREVRDGDCEEIANRDLGWLVTDFGLDDFISEGMLSFSLRGGNPLRLGTGRGKLYAEKVIIQRKSQGTPYLRHIVRTKDIANRGGGKLCLSIYLCAEDGDLDREQVVPISVDGRRRRLAPGAKLSLAPGESVTLPPGAYHSYWAEEADVLAIEVALAGSELSDNYFHEQACLLPSIDEDEAPRRLLVCDYPTSFPELTRG